MKILYHHRTRADDGQAVHVSSLIEAFVERGHEVLESALVRHTGPEAEARRSGAANSDPTAQSSRWAWVGRLPRAALEVAEYAYSHPARRRLRREARAFQPDFLYERYAFGNEAGVHAARSLKLPIVLEVNSPMVHELGATRGLAFPAYARRVERRIFRGATRVAVVTAVLGEMLVEGGVDPERLIITPNGVRLELYGKSSPAQARMRMGVQDLRVPLLGFVGYLRDWHRLDRVARAMSDPSLKQAQLIVIGEGPGEAGLREAARHAGTEQRVHFLGTRPHTEIPDLLPAFDVALVPAINPYASPLKLHEYMAAGLAVVAPNQANLREVVAHGRTAMLVDPQDDDDLGSAVAHLVADEDLRKRLGAAARRTIEERDLTWVGNADRIVRAVESLG